MVPSYVSKHSWYNYCVLLKNKKMKIKFKRYLKQNKTDFRESFPLFIYSLYINKLSKKNKSPKSVHTFNRFIDLPIWSNMSEFQINYIIKK